MDHLMRYLALALMFLLPPLELGATQLRVPLTGADDELDLSLKLTYTASREITVSGSTSSDDIGRTIADATHKKSWWPKSWRVVVTTLPKTPLSLWQILNKLHVESVFKTPSLNIDLTEIAVDTTTPPEDELLPIASWCWAPSASITVRLASSLLTREGVLPRENRKLMCFNDLDGLRRVNRQVTTSPSCFSYPVRFIIDDRPMVSYPEWQKIEQGRLRRACVRSSKNRGESVNGDRTA